MMNWQKVLVASFVVCLALIAWDEVQEKHLFPRPQRFVSAGVVFVLLGIMSAFGVPNLAAAFGVGVDVALLYDFSWASNKKPPSSVGKQIGE